MKINFAIVLVSALLPMACGQISEIEKNIAEQSAVLSSADQASNQLYLDDVTDSAADDAEEGVEGAAVVEESVKDDVKAERLAQMVTKMLTELDSDTSGSLSLEEFLVGPSKRAEEVNADAEKIAKITAKMTEDFKKYAGAELILSSAELTTLLKESAPRVCRHRQEKFPGQHEERVKLTWADVIAKYDTDADGKLSQAEYEAMEADKKAGNEKFKEEKKGPQGGGKGGKGQAQAPEPKAK